MASGLFVGITCVLNAFENQTGPTRDARLESSVRNSIRANRDEEIGNRDEGNVRRKPDKGVMLDYRGIKRSFILEKGKKNRGCVCNL